MRKILVIVLALVMLALVGCKPSIRPDRVKSTPAASPMSGPGPDGAITTPSVYYGTCTEAAIAGATPLYRGDPGYREPLDHNHDGIACEK